MPVMAILLISLLCFAGGYWLGQAQAPGHRVAETSASSLAKAEYANLKARYEQQSIEMDRLGLELQKWKAVASRDASSKVGDLEFYKDLPNQPVMPAPLTEAGASRASEVTKVPAKQPGERQTEPPANESSRMLATIIGREMQRSETGMYRIQAGSFRSLADARPLQKRLDGAGFQSFIDAVDLGEKGKWQRVYVGPFASQGAAEKAKRELRDRLKISGLLVKVKG
jgi:cell division septation protein DedD